MNVLIVDECEELRTALSLLFLVKGYTVFESENAKNALNILSDANTNFDLLLTDFSIKGMTGIELIEEVIKLKLNVHKIVILSSLNIDEKLLEPLMSKNSHVKFLHKMTTTANLLNFIEN